MDNKLRSWQQTLVTPRLAVSSNGNQIQYHELLEDQKDCKSGEINTYTYTQENPKGRPSRIHRNQLLGIFSVNQFGTAAQWRWPGMEHMADLVFGDPDWKLYPFGESEESVYEIEYIPHPPVIVANPETYSEN